MDVYDVAAGGCGDGTASEGGRDGGVLHGWATEDAWLFAQQGSHG